jgi:hypothetical protein
MRLRLLFVIGLVALVAVPGFAQNGPAGTWNASVETPQGPFALVFDFAVVGETLTGSMSNDFMGATPISDGRVEGNQIAFSLSIDGGPAGAMNIAYTGTVDGDTLTLTSTFEGAPPGGGPAEQVLTATRVAG